MDNASFSIGNWHKLCIMSQIVPQEQLTEISLFFLFCFFLPITLYHYHNEKKKDPKLGTGSISKSCIKWFSLY